MTKSLSKIVLLSAVFDYTQCNLSLFHMQSLSFSKLTKMSTICFVLSVT